MADSDQNSNDAAPSESVESNTSKQNIRGMTLTATLLANNSNAKPEQDGDSASPKVEEEPPIVTRHAIEVDGRMLRYSVTTGFLPIKNDKGEIEAKIFFMAYIRDRVDAADSTDSSINSSMDNKADTGVGSSEDNQDRPLMFSFNGGPGSSSVWLHLGALGPKRVELMPDGNLPPPPYRMVDNPHTWLDQTDLVFIDPVGTGYSRPTKPEYGKKFWEVEGDIACIGEFIRLYLTRYERWTSPLYLVGESYGTTRAAGLSGHLIEQGIAFNGILLVSSILNFQTAYFNKGNDLPYLLFLPTYTATAWVHGKLDAALQEDLRCTLEEVEQWALNEYAYALAKGDGLSEEERSAVAAKLARYTGLSEKFVSENDLRIHIDRFCKELLRSEKRTVGRLDSRIKGKDPQVSGDEPDFDPSMTTIRPPYTAVFNHYVRTQLGYKTDMPYHILGGGIKTPWGWNLTQGYVDTSTALRAAFAKNPHMRLFVASGYYDLATPYFATDFTLNHMGLDSELRRNVVTATYEAGHMMYIHEPSLVKLKADVSKFLDNE